jgi:hypothetical protein
MGFLLQLMNKDWSDKDDDGESFYDKIPEFEKQRNSSSCSTAGSYVKIPMPWGYNVFPNFGRMLARMWQGERPMTAMGDWGMGVLDAFNPIGGAQSILDVLSPTITDPIVDLEQNRDYAGARSCPTKRTSGRSRRTRSATGTASRHSTRRLPTSSRSDRRRWRPPWLNRREPRDARLPAADGHRGPRAISCATTARSLPRR